MDTNHIARSRQEPKTEVWGQASRLIDLPAFIHVLNSMTIMGRSSFFGFVFVAALFLMGCQTAYYKTMETFGVHKRDILKDNVEDARNEQEKAAEQFKDALTR